MFNDSFICAEFKLNSVRIYRFIGQLVLIFATIVNKINQWGGPEDAVTSVILSYRIAAAHEKNFSAGKMKLITDSKKVERKTVFWKPFAQNSKLENLSFHTLTPWNVLNLYFCIWSSLMERCWKKRWKFRLQVLGQNIHIHAEANKCKAFEGNCERFWLSSGTHFKVRPFQGTNSSLDPKVLTSFFWSHQL